MPNNNNSNTEWPSVVVAVGILALLGAVLVTATARWTSTELKDLLVALAPVLGIVTGAFVTYFFTRQAAATAVSAAQNATTVATRSAEAARAQTEAQTEQLKAQADRSRALHNALTAAWGMVDGPTRQKMRQDRVISSVLEPR